MSNAAKSFSGRYGVRLSILAAASALILVVASSGLWIASRY